jgi:phosphoribosylamine-glycine ligase
MQHATAYTHMTPTPAQWLTPCLCPPTCRCAAQGGVEVLVIGAGGREHAIALALAASPHVATVHVAPGNGGTAAAGGKLRNAAVSASDCAALAAFAAARGVALAAVGPEVPLVAGVADALAAVGVPCFGPSAAAARLEASKAWSKDFMARHGIRTAR